MDESKAKDVLFKTTDLPENYSNLYKKVRGEDVDYIWRFCRSFGGSFENRFTRPEKNNKPKISKTEVIKDYGREYGSFSNAYNFSCHQKVSHEAFKKIISAAANAGEYKTLEEFFDGFILYYADEVDENGKSTLEKIDSFKGNEKLVVKVLRKAGKKVPNSFLQYEHEYENPYRGLGHFKAKDKDHFFGRINEISDLIRTIKTQAFTTVKGASGAGKSSLVMAGVIPELTEKYNYLAITLTPKSSENYDPFFGLANAIVKAFYLDIPIEETELIDKKRKLQKSLKEKATNLGEIVASYKKSESNVLLVIDQFEEILNFSDKYGQTYRAFIDLLVRSYEATREHSSPTFSITLILRHDFIGKFDNEQDFANILQKSEVGVPQLDRKMLPSIIKGPANLTHTEVNDSVIEAIQKDAENTKNFLPLVEFANPDRDTVEHLSAMSDARSRPVAMFVDHSDAALSKAAIAAGLSAYVVGGFQMDRIKPVLETAIARFQMMSQMKSELTAAKQALEDRKTLDRAKGLLMRARDLSEDEAYSLLRRTAMDQNRKVADVAKALVVAADLLK